MELELNKTYTTVDGSKVILTWKCPNEEVENLYIGFYWREPMRVLMNNKSWRKDGTCMEDDYEPENPERFGEHRQFDKKGKNIIIP